jgi:O-antigen/teichoic acid export membrane protein
MVVLTFGIWLLAIPLYPARCVVCGLSRSSAIMERLSMKQRAIIFLCIMAFLVLCAIHGGAR